MDGIRMEKVTKDYTVEDKVIHVLQGTDLSIPSGEITVVLGRSGCGKTTLLRIIGELESMDSGEIYGAKGKSAFVFQEARLMPWLTVERNIVFGVEKKDVNQEAVDQVVETVGLRGFEKAFPRQLSGGMQHRVALARALMYRPSFLLMDEPFAALDFFTREQMQKELIRVQQENHCGILFVTHSIDEALLLGHHIVILDKGLVKDRYSIPKPHEKRDLLDGDFIEMKKNIIKQLNID